MLIFKPTKQSLIKRIANLDKATIKSTYPNIVIIEQETNGWSIQEQYYKPNKQVQYKELFYNDYNEYLKTANLNDKTVVIVNDLPKQEA